MVFYTFLVLQSPIDYEQIGKVYGPLGVIFVLAVIGIVTGARAVKALILGTIEDARKERDYMRIQREREASAFIESLKQQGEIFKEGFDEVLHELRENHPRRNR